MSGFGRVLVDVSYTRTQTANVGITRTVRRLLAELQPLLHERSIDVTPVAYHSLGFREAAAVTPSAPTGGGGGLVAALWRLLHAGAFRRFAVACIPARVLGWIWRAHGAWTFDHLSAGESPVVFTAGDLLLLCDESWNYQAWTAAQRAAAQGATIVMVCYDLIPIRHPEFCAALFTTAFRHWLVSMLPCCHAVLCISRATQHDLLRFCAEEGLATPVATHFRLGCDIRAGRAERKPRAALHEFLTGEAPCFLAVGTIEPRKNHRFLLKTFEHLWARGVNVRLLVIGRPHPDCHDLVSKMRNHAEQGRLLLNVFDAADVEIDLAYSACRALVLPSLAEGFGLPLVEARTRGCPVIASRLPALAELADAGVFLFDPDRIEALEALLLEHARQDLRHQLQPMPAFTWRDSAAECLEGVTRLIEGREAPVSRNNPASGVRPALGQERQA
jgi:glycosyltransferase involved in cell wall biosynthesis